MLTAALFVLNFLASPSARAADCAQASLAVHTGWDQSGTYLGDVKLFGVSAFAMDGESVCISYDKDGRTRYGQWRCDRDDQRFEFVQNLSLRSSFDDPSSCTHKYTGGTFVPR